MMNGNVDGGGSKSGNASEPSGEGVEADYVDGIDDGGGGQDIDLLLIDIMPYNYYQSIELLKGFPKHHSSPSYDYYKLR
eukprot:scaffold38275_cov292-Skeletonema_marinoi.AAC.3